MLKIALIFHSASNDNMGVGALSVSEVAILRRLAQDRGLDLHITVIDGAAQRPPYVTGADITIRYTRPLRKPVDFFRAVRAADLVIDIGGGDSFADIYGRRRLTQMFVMKYLTHLARKPLVLAPQTFGPFRHSLSTFLARHTIRRSAPSPPRATACRPPACARWASRQRSSRPRRGAAPALRSPPERPEGGPVRVGINVSGLLMSGGYTARTCSGCRWTIRSSCATSCSASPIIPSLARSTSCRM